MNETRTDEGPVLVTGARGKTGRRVAAALTAAGVPVRAVSRSTEPRFDWDDRDSWADSLNGVRAAYVAFQPDLAVPNAAETVGAFAAAAVKAGVGRLVLLSGRGEPAAAEAEAAVRSALPRTTVVRASWFAQNFSEGYLLDSVLSGTVALPVRDVGEPFIDVDDIADVAVAALMDERHAGETYEVTGPRALTFAEAVAEIARATGRPVELLPIGVDEFRAALLDEGVPSDIVGLLAMLFTETLDGRNEATADGVERALGRAPRDFATFARAAAAAGIWDVRAEVAVG